VLLDARRRGRAKLGDACCERGHLLSLLLNYELLCSS
jgi:hypothetical protein